MMLDESEQQQMPAFENATLQTQEGVRIVWANLLEVIVDDGPFSTRVSGKM